MSPIALFELILVLAAMILFGLAAFGIGGGRFNLVAAGLCSLTVGAFLLPML